MSLHQIIYTSCMRGINGVNDGQQVYSHDALFKDANNDEVKSLFSYQPPNLEAGVIMTEEIALTLPKSFSFRKLSNGAYALALNTYLGRDYMGSSGRFGNSLSHVVVADELDIQNYPCEFYACNLLRDQMEFEEVNNPNKPDFLPEPVLEPGYLVNVEEIIDFLGVDNRLEVFKNMLHAVLCFETERKRVVICDEPENIIMWIAAVEYALPLKIALGINFSTYDFDPALSESQICGVIPKGSRYNAESQRFHFVFDLYQNNCADFEKDDNFFEFIDTSMSFSYDSLQDFHQFIVKGYTYDKADENMYDAYRLYTLLSDGISNHSESELKSALDFAREYAFTKEQFRILENLLQQRDALLSTDEASFICIMSYCVSNYAKLEQNYREFIRNIMVDRVLRDFLDNDCGEEAFVSFYSEADSICRKGGGNIATELMKEENLEKLYAMMQNDISKWKIAFIVRVVSTFVKDQKIPVNELFIDVPLGQTYYGLVHAVYSKNHQNGFYLVKRIIDEFGSDCKYLVNMALNIEGVLFDIPDGNREVDSLWKYFGQAMMKYQRANLKIAYSIFNSYQRYELIYMLYSLAMFNSSNATESQSAFIEHNKTFVEQNDEYAAQYKLKILSDYYEKLKSFDNHSSYTAKVELFYILVADKVDLPFSVDFVNELVKDIPFESPSKGNRKLVITACEHLYNDLRKPVTNKLLLLVVAMFLEECKKMSQLHDVLDSLEKMIVNSKADLSRVTEQSVEKYFDWLLPKVCELCEHASDIERFYNIFEMPNNISDLFFKTCAKLYLKQSRNENNYRGFCNFLSLVFKEGNLQTRGEIGEVLCKLSRKKLSDLDEQVNEAYQSDSIAIQQWSEIRETAESTSPILNNLSNLFKRKKD